jgi:D-arabinose 1-dehydrogenase-like Zn-dependent alcohol dehydrogenase
MRSARIVKTYNPLVIDEDRPGPKPKNSRVFVKVKAAGICHSDLHLWGGGDMVAGGKFMQVGDRVSHIPYNPWLLGLRSSWRYRRIRNTVSKRGQSLNISLDWCEFYFSFFRPSQDSKNLTNVKRCEVLVDFVNNYQTDPIAIEVFRKRGRYIMLGLFGRSLELNLPLVPLRAFNITGAYTHRYMI